MSIDYLSRLRFENPAPDKLDDLRDDGVAEGPKSVHPSGNPMSHSTHVGFSEPSTAVRKLSPPSLPEEPGPPVPSLDVGVGQTARPNRPLIGTFGLNFPSLWSRAVGVGHRSITWAIRFGTGFLRTCPGDARWSQRGFPSLSDATGVCHIRAAIPNGIPPCANRVEWSPVVAVGHRPRLLGPDDPDAIAEVRGTDGGSWNAVPLRVIPELGQVAKDCPHPSVSSQESWDVLHEDVAGS